MTRRYEVRGTSVYHPWANRRNANGEIVRKVVEGAEVFDTETRDYIGEGTTKIVAAYDRARELNGMPPMTTAKIKRALSKARIPLSTSHATRIRGWHNWTAGIEVRRGPSGTFVLSYTRRMHGNDPMDIPALMDRAAEALKSAGIECTRTIQDNSPIIEA